MKQLICILCTISLLSSAAFAISSADLAANPDVVEQKLALVEYAEAYLAAHPQTPTQVLTPEEEIDLIIACEKQNLSDDEKKAILNPVGIFQLDSGNAMPTLAHANDADMIYVTLNHPSLYVSAASSGSWYVTMSGEWSIDDPWSRHISGTGNIGGFDRFGISYAGASSPCPARLDARGWMDDGAAHEKISTSVMGASRQNGVGFEFQDFRGLDNGRFYSVGKRFGCAIAYPAEFAYFSSTILSYYAHTWSDCVMTEFEWIPPSLGGGIHVEFERPSRGFMTYSGAKTTFSMGPPPVPVFVPVGFIVLLSSGLIFLFRKLFIS